MPRPDTLSENGKAWRRIAPFLLIAAAGILAYANGLRGAFVYDDVSTIAENASLRHLTHLGAVLSPAHQAGTAQGRPVLSLSLALNYAAGGLDPVGYHLVNVAIHVLAGLTLYALARRTLLAGRGLERFRPAAAPLALATGVLWTVHPLQTEAVTYTVQRAESLMGLFYFLTLWSYLRAATEPDRRRWPALAVIFCLLGMGTKEVMVSAPVIVLLFDRAFLAGSFREAWRKRGRLLLVLALTWLPLAGLVAAGGGTRGGSVGFGLGVSPGDYWLSQGEAILHYLRLVFWPHPLIFDYGSFLVSDPLAALLRTAVVLGLVVAAFAAWARRPAIGFLGLWFFAILAPTSLLPGTTQMIVEHRMYVALAPVLILVTTGAYRWLGRRSLWLWAGVAPVLIALTMARNRQYRTEESIWRDTVAKRPANALAHYSLGHALAQDPSRADAAVSQYEEAIRLNPAYADAHDALGLLWQRQAGGLPAAIGQYRAAVALAPKDAKARNNLGNALLDLPGGLPEALAELKEAEALDPANADIRANLARACNDAGVALAGQGELDRAVTEFREALKEDPDLAATRFNLAVVLSQIPGQQAAAAAEFRRVLQQQPDNERAREMLQALGP